MNSKVSHLPAADNKNIRIRPKNQMTNSTTLGVSTVDTTSSYDTVGKSLSELALDFNEIDAELLLGDHMISSKPTKIETATSISKTVAYRKHRKPLHMYSVAHSEMDVPPESNNIPMSSPSIKHDTTSVSNNKNLIVESDADVPINTTKHIRHITRKHIVTGKGNRASLDPKFYHFIDRQNNDIGPLFCPEDLVGTWIVLTQHNDDHLRHEWCVSIKDEANKNSVDHEFYWEQLPSRLNPNMLPFSFRRSASR